MNTATSHHPPDPAAIHTPRPPMRIWPHLAAGVAASATTLWAFRVPYGHTSTIDFAFLLWLLTLILWLAGTMSWHIHARTHGPRCSPRIVIHFLAPWCLLFATVAGASTDLPFNISFALSRPALDRFADRTVQSGQIPPDARVGLYHLTAIETIPEGLRFKLSGARFDRIEYGFARFPNGPPPNTDASGYYPLAGDWYVWDHIPHLDRPAP